ncbi:MAG: hypothetical protein M3065_11180 [Actinomycetota bacterium]|nr:hypothetical protein [Actinomycetota bacterium]
MTALISVAVAMLAIIALVSLPGGGRSAARRSPLAAAGRADPIAASLTAPLGRGHLAPGSVPAVLPAPILIADKANSRLLIVDQQGRIRWQFPRPGDLAPGQSFSIPDDAFFTPDGRDIIVTQEDDYTISVIDVATHRIVYRYGHPGVPGMAAGYLHNPDDAMMLPDHFILTPDIKNCRLLLIPPAAQAPTRVYGTSSSGCLHDPPARWGSPNGAFPLADGHYLITEINGDWVDEIGLDGTVYWSTHPPGVAYPSDSNQIGPNRYLTVDYFDRGQIVVFDGAGRTLWRYAPSTAPAALNHPSLALPLPNGDILLNDDYNDRVIVVDPHTQRIVWQYGHDGVPGSTPGYLNVPDGVDLLPPRSLLVSHAASMGQPSARLDRSH